MEEAIATLSKSLAGFCNHLQSSCEALTQSVDRRLIPLDSASSTFIEGLNGRVKSASGDLNLLESTSCGTVSFEELLGHCNEVYKKNQTDFVELEDHLKKFGYIPDFHVDDEDEVPTNLSTTSFPSELANDLHFSNQMSVSTTGRRNVEEDALLDESLSLESVGLSDVCLATLASEGNGKTYDPDMDEPTRFLEKSIESNSQCQPAAWAMGVFVDKMLVGFGEAEVNSKSKQSVAPLIMLSKDDFDSLPSYMKGLASWEDLLVAANKINSSLKQKTKGEYYIRQDEISSLDLDSSSRGDCRKCFSLQAPKTYVVSLKEEGPKARSYLLLLVRLKRLLVETVDGLISYRVV